MVRRASTDGQQEVELAGDRVAVLNERDAGDGLRHVGERYVPRCLDAYQGRHRQPHSLPVDDDPGSRDHSLFCESTNALVDS